VLHFSIAPWALVSGYGTRDSWGANAHFTALRTQDYALDSAGISVGLADRVELSLAQQHLTGSLAPLDRLRIRQDILGIKLRLAGDAVYGQDQALPQLAVGALFKRQRGIADLGERSHHGADLYLAATRICLDSSVLLNATLRATRANQMGLLGFGGDQDNRYRVMPELSAAWMASRKLVAGLEYRHRPHNLASDREQPNYDVFVAWFPSKQLSLTAAYVVLGQVTVFNPTRQRGAYLSLQAGF